MSALTEKQESVIRLFALGDEVNEERISDELWPKVRNARLVVNALVAKQLVVLGSWDDWTGYELQLTAAGQIVLARFANPETKR